MILDVDTDSPVPPYEQIRAQITDLADTGLLTTGTRLPPIRQLAGDLGLATGTVARAYRELETAGVVVSRVRHGTTIAERDKPTNREAAERLTAAARSYALVIATLGVERGHAVRALDEQLAELGS